MTYPATTNDWSAFPPVTSQRQLNIVNGDMAVYKRILTLLLLKKGEDPLHPEMGLGIDIFDSLSSDNSQYLIHNIKQALVNWNTWAAIGIASFEVNLNDQTSDTNKLSIAVNFSSINSGESTILTFGYYQYTNAMLTSDYAAFLDSVAVNGVRLKEWKY